MINISTLRDSIILEVQKYAIIEARTFGKYKVDSKFYSSLESALHRYKNQNDFKEKILKFILKRILLPEESFNKISKMFEKNI